MTFNFHRQRSGKKRTSVHPGMTDMDLLRRNGATSGPLIANHSSNGPIPATGGETNTNNKRPTPIFRGNSGIFGAETSAPRIIARTLASTATGAANRRTKHFMSATSSSSHRQHETSQATAAFNAFSSSTPNIHTQNDTPSRRAMSAQLSVSANKKMRPHSTKPVVVPSSSKNVGFSPAPPSTTTTTAEQQYKAPVPPCPDDAVRPMTTTSGNRRYSEKEIHAAAAGRDANDDDDHRQLQRRDEQQQETPAMTFLHRRDVSTPPVSESTGLGFPFNARDSYGGAAAKNKRNAVGTPSATSSSMGTLDDRALSRLGPRELKRYKLGLKNNTPWAVKAEVDAHLYRLGVEDEIIHKKQVQQQVRDDFLAQQRQREAIKEEEKRKNHLARLEMIKIEKRDEEFAIRQRMQKHELRKRESELRAEEFKNAELRKQEAVLEKRLAKKQSDEIAAIENAQLQAQRNAEKQRKFKQREIEVENHKQSIIEREARQKAQHDDEMHFIEEYKRLEDTRARQRSEKRKEFQESIARKLDVVTKQLSPSFETLAERQAAKAKKEWDSRAKKEEAYERAWNDRRVAKERNVHNDIAQQIQEKSAQRQREKQRRLEEENKLIAADRQQAMTEYYAKQSKLSEKKTKYGQALEQQMDSQVHAYLDNLDD